MKEIRIVLDDADYKTLLKLKGKMTWKQFLMIGVKYDNNKL
jgi:hypothetical protein